MDKAEKQGKMVYLFEEGRANMRSLLGGKGAGLAEMTRIGLPVPPGITITTEVCRQYYKVGNRFPDGLKEQIEAGLADIEKKTGKIFGDATNPLLLSVRSGAVFSMPGMMDTILNLGLNDVTVEGMAAATANRRFAFDAYRRFIQMFGDVVLEIPKHDFEELLTKRKELQGVKFDQELTDESLAAVVADYKKLVVDQSGRPFPQDPVEQLFMAVEAVFRSWNNERAIVYRNLNRISHDLGTAVNIQSMVFGNMGDDCGTGVAFTRNPSTGEKALYGEFLTNAQGEDVVAGIRTPRPISELKDQMPEMYKQFVKTADTLEHHYKDMQDIEFTIERGRLYMLQTRNGKRTGRAAVQVAYDLVQENILTPAEAIMKVEPAHIEQLMHRTIDPKAKLNVIAKGLPASPGAASGAVVFDADTAAKKAAEGIKTLLVRMETTPEDIHGMVAAQGILTSRGGMTSHAAVVARGMGKPCVSGCDALKIDYENQTATVAGQVIKAGDILSIDGSTGRVILGAVPVVDAIFSKEYEQVLKWADSLARMKVRANADTPEDAERARAFGAQGIGLTRTEHMFMGADRLPHVQRMILAESPAERVEPLSHIQKMQEADFYGILKAMHGLPVTIRLLDPPLHEFLPHDDAGQAAMAKEMGVSAATIKNRVDDLHECNPMMGHRGCRLGICYPEITEMQARAVIEAALNAKAKGSKVKAEIMIPLVTTVREFNAQAEVIRKTIDKVFAERNDTIEYMVGTMIETPRGALVADSIGKQAEFFSFGTNDLTQMTLGFSRDDIGKFLPMYLSNGMYEQDPFQSIDQKGVGLLVKDAVQKGRSVRPNIKLGVCGEHGGDPASIDFFHRVGLDYVSCSPFRVPIARLAAAQAAISNS